MYTITKEFHFSASHQLRLLPDDHQCARLHGHNYILKVELAGYELDGVGFVLDYGELKFVKDIVDGYDHRHLNDLVSFNPTSENMCKFICMALIDYLQQVAPALTRRLHHIAVELSETPKTNARYERIF